MPVNNELTKNQSLNSSNNKIYKSASLEENLNESDNINNANESKLIILDTYINPENLTQTYFKRWIILFIFSFISLLSAFNWIEYNIIQDVTIAFYNKSLPEDEVEQNDAVNWFSMVYMLCYIPLVFPAMFLLDKKGLKLSCILGALLTTIGSIIKCAAVNPNLFAVAMLGQTICAIAQAFTLSVPARLSALWYNYTWLYHFKTN